MAPSSRSRWSSALVLVLVAVIAVPTGAMASLSFPTEGGGGTARLGYGPNISGNKIHGATPSTSGPGKVNWTLCLLNGQLLSGNEGCHNGVTPFALAYDSENGHLYVTNYGSDSVSVINGVTDTVVGSISVESYPYAVVYDSADGYIYVANDGSSNLSVINGTTDMVVGSVSVGLDPDGLAYDSGNGYIYAANYGSSNVSVINGTTDTVVGSVSVGTWPDGLAYDSGNGYIYVANGGSGNVTEINGATDLVVGSVPVGGRPDAIGYDMENGYLYVTNMNLDNVNVINGSKGITVGVVPVGSDPDGVAYDRGNGYLYVANYDSSNLTVINGATEKVVGSVGVWSLPVGVAYDNANGYLYVANSGSDSNNVTVVNGTTNTIVGSIFVGVVPLAVAYDTKIGYLYVANGGSDNVTVVDGATDKVVDSVSVGTWPDGLAYDSGNGYIYVANDVSSNVSVIDGGTGSVVGSVPVGSVPLAVAYDSENGDLYVTNYGSDSVSVINGVTDRVVGSISVWRFPDGVGYDSVNGYIYVANEYSNNVSIIDGATDTVVGSVSVGSNPTAVEYDSVNDYIYVANGGSENITIISGATDRVVGSVPVGSGPDSMAYDSADGYLYVANQGSNNVTVINGATQEVVGSISVGSYPLGVGFDTTNGYVYVANRDSGSVSIITTGHTPAAYPIDFSESGLPYGTNWSVTLAGIALASTTSTLTFSELNGTYSFTVGAVLGYTSNITSGLTRLNGSGVTLPITFAKNSTSRRTYTVAFTESGLPSGTSWSVTFNGTPGKSSTPSIVFNNLLNNTTGYAFTVGAVSGYTASPSSGSVVVNGANVTKSITFTKSSTGKATYAVIFSESGLPPGTSWSVTLNTTTNSGTRNLNFTEPNGTYSFSVGAVAGYRASQTSGTIIVDGKANSTSIAFTALSAGRYSAIFSESGLPTGTNWSVTFFGLTEASTASTIAFTAFNGSWTFSIAAVEGYSAAPESGSITVNGTSQFYNITFTPISKVITYALTFTETGLPSGLVWRITINGAPQPVPAPTNPSVLTLMETNGTYDYVVTPPSGYTANPSSGTALVDGKNFTVNMTFSSTSPPSKNSTSTFLGLPGSEGYLLIGLIVAAVAFALAVVVLRKRKGSQLAPSPPPPAVPPSTP